ncbi:MAG TPA: DUF3800 domain-containing protein [Terracidiphilus sp.]|nr:DUF3800 domain-containing protein [Terracidiphilus sp.]
MLTAYLDESGHDRKDFALIAGFLGNAEQWEKCEEDWIAALGSRRHLHMNSLQWSKEQRVGRLLARLGPIPHAAGLTALYAVARVADYEDLIDGTHMQKLMKGYQICVLGIVNLLMQDTSPNETFKTVFENQNEYANSVVQMHKGSRECAPDGRKRWASVEFVEKDDTVLTEPADYLAYALLQQARDPQSTRTRLCFPILQNPRYALARDHRLPEHREILRKFIWQMTEQHPNLMRSKDVP